MSDIRAEVLAWLDEQEKLAAGAYPGPWVATEDEYGRTDRLQYQKDGRSADVIVTDSGYYPPDWPTGQFIAASRTALPLALAALRAEAEYHEPFQEMEDGQCDACEERWPCDAIRRIHSSLGLK